jgi:hypothetical protein
MTSWKSMATKVSARARLLSHTVATVATAYARARTRAGHSQTSMGTVATVRDSARQ